MKLTSLALVSATALAACHGDSKPASSAKPAEPAPAANAPTANAPAAPTPTPAPVASEHPLAAGARFAGVPSVRLASKDGPVEVSMVQADDDVLTTRLVARLPGGTVEIDREEGRDHVAFQFALTADHDGVVWARWSDYYKRMTIARYRFDADAGAFHRQGDPAEVSAREELPAWAPAELGAVLGSTQKGGLQKLYATLTPDDHATWTSPAGAAWTLTIESTDDGHAKLVAAHDGKRDVLVDAGDSSWVSSDVALAGTDVVFHVVSPSSHSGFERAYRLAWDARAGALAVVAKEEWDRI